MSSKIECANSSSLELTSKGISIWLPMQVFGALWSLLVNQISGQASNSPISTIRVRKMTLRDSLPDAPRWIANQIDVLSWFVPQGDAKRSLFAESPHESRISSFMASY